MENKRPRRKQRGIATLFLTFHAPQGAGNSPVILLKGNEFLRAEAYEEALVCYEKALEIDPMYSDAWNNHGITLRRLERYEESLISFNKAVKLAPIDKIAWKNRAKLLSEELNLYEEAINSYNKCVEIDQNDWESWWLRGADLEVLGFYEEAADSYNKSLQIKHDIFFVWVKRGKNFYLNMHKYEESLFCYDKALEFFKIRLAEFPQVQVEEYPIWMTKGFILYDLERYEEALYSLQKALEFKPNEHEAILWFRCGNVLYHLNFHTKAIFCFDKVLEIQPENRDSWSNKGFIFKENKLYEDALFCYDEALSLTDEDSEEWDNIFQEIRNIEEIIEDAQTSNHLKNYNIKKSSQELCIEGLDEYAKREHQLAIHKFTEAIEVDSGYALAYKCRGYIHFKTRNYIETINDLTHFIKLNSADKTILNFRAIAYYNLGQHEQAISDLKEVENLLYLFTNWFDINDPNIEQYNKISSLIKVYQEWKIKVESSPFIEFDEDVDEDENEDDYLDNSNSEFFKSLIMLGDFAYESENFDSAIEYYTTALTVDPNNSEIYNKRSTARSAIKDYQGAMEDLQKVKTLFQN